MLRRTTSALMLLATAGMAQACPGFGFGFGFGFETSCLSDCFCHQFNALPSPGRVRSAAAAPRLPRRATS
jgi:hypothetical protein